MRKFIPVGLPPSAVKLCSPAIPLARNVQILATDKNETIVGTKFMQPSILHDAQHWSLNRRIIVAESANQAVVTAQGGIYRVDLGRDAQFICAPANIVGVHGHLNARVVFSESRLDVVNAWTKLVIGNVGSAGESVWNSIKYVGSKLPIKKIPLQLPFKLPSQYAQKVVVVRYKLWNYLSRLSDFTFRVLHPPKIEVRGPCSLLIKA